MSQLFLNLGFVVPEGSEDEQLLLANIWKQVGGDPEGEQEVLLRNMKVIMCCIQNFHLDWIIDYERPGDEKVVPSKLGHFDEEDNLTFTPSEISYLTKKYVSLYKNRQNTF